MFSKWLFCQKFNILISNNISIKTHQARFSRYYLTYKSTFYAEKPKKLAKTSLTDRARLEQMLKFWNVIMCTFCTEQRNLL